MKSLRIIQVLAKIARVLCIICFVCCIVGAVACLAGLIVLPIIQDKSFPDGKTVVAFLLEHQLTLEVCYSGLAVGLLGSGVGIFLAKYNELFFKEEIAVGTPFKMDIVRKMRRMSLVNIIVSISASVLAAIVVLIIQTAFQAKFKFNYGLVSTVGFGISMLIISLFCEYGAEPEKVEEEENK